MLNPLDDLHFVLLAVIINNKQLMAQGFVLPAIVPKGTTARCSSVVNETATFTVSFAGLDRRQRSRSSTKYAQV
jgi:hypothetical protein